MDVTGGSRFSKYNAMVALDLTSQPSGPSPIPGRVRRPQMSYPTPCLVISPSQRKTARTPRKLFGGSGLHLLISPSESTSGVPRELVHGREKLLSLCLYRDFDSAPERRLGSYRF
jgi:hypothetical protein